MKFKALLTLALVFAFCAPAQARVTFGVVPPANNLIRTDAQAQHFAAYLQRSLGEEVKLRILQDEPTLHNWLNRFREVDVAVVSRAYIERQPAGEFFALAEDFAARVSGAPLADPVIARQGLNLQLLQRLQYALDAMSQDQGLRNILWPAPAKKPAPPAPAPAPAPRKKAEPPVSKAPAKAPEVVKPPKPEPTAPVAPEPQQTTQPQAPQVAKTEEKPKVQLPPAVQKPSKELPPAKAPEKPKVQKAQAPVPAPEAKAPAEAQKPAPVDPHALGGHHEHIDYLFWTGILAAALGALLVMRFLLRLRRQKRIERFSWVPEVTEQFGLDTQQSQAETGISPVTLPAAGLSMAEKQPAPRASESQPAEEPEAQQEPDITEESLGLVDLSTPTETVTDGPAMKIADPISDHSAEHLEGPGVSTPQASTSGDQESAQAEEAETTDPLWAAITEIEATKTEADTEVSPPPEICTAPSDEGNEEVTPRSPQPVPFDFELEANEEGAVSAAMEGPAGLNPEQETEADSLQEVDQPEASALWGEKNASLDLATDAAEKQPLELQIVPEQAELTEEVQEPGKSLEVAAPNQVEPTFELADGPEQTEASEAFQEKAGSLEVGTTDEEEQSLELAAGPEQSETPEFSQEKTEALEVAAADDEEQPLELADGTEQNEAPEFSQEETGALEVAAADEEEQPLELADGPEQSEAPEVFQEEIGALEVAAADDEEQPLELADGPEQNEAPEVFQEETGALEVAATGDEEQPLELAEGPEQTNPSALDQSVLDALEAAAEPPQDLPRESTNEVGEPEPDSLDQGVIEALEAAAAQPEAPPAEQESERPASPQVYEPDAVDLETDLAANDPMAPEAIEAAEEPGPPEGQPEPAKPAEGPVMPAASTEPLKLNLRGRLGEIQIPALLQLIAPQTRPGSLIITTRHDEKRFHFRNGRISLASSVSRANRSKSGFLMNKVGYLLIRQGTITEEQRDQALELCEKTPSKRIGEALIELGALSREALMEALRTQAESIIFSLFIFPEGQFEFIYEDFPLRPENDLGIEVPKLLEKASHHEAEWNNIREGIPSIDTVLDFAEGGRQKLASARMTVHQKLVLSLIDGKRPIKEICVAATMLDLEVYKFLFFMVHAKILKRLEPVKEDKQLSA